MTHRKAHTAFRVPGGGRGAAGGETALAGLYGARASAAAGEGDVREIGIVLRVVAALAVAALAGLLLAWGWAWLAHALPWPGMGG